MNHSTDEKNWGREITKYAIWMLALGVAVAFGGVLAAQVSKKSS